MDASLFILPIIAAMTTGCWIVTAALLSKSPPGFRAPFLLAFGLAVLWMEPWGVGGLREGAMIAVMLLGVSIPIAVGCAIGGFSATMLVALGAKLKKIACS